MTTAVVTTVERAIKPTMPRTAYVPRLRAVTFQPSSFAEMK
jgi:hypothetical protein